MTQGPTDLTEREKAALRLLLAGHDAKSMAVTLGLSVHTIHERLREARRKLGVSSSREAARRLAHAEQDDPQFLTGQQIGDASPPPIGPAIPLPGVPIMAPSAHPRHGSALVWLSGGMLIMSLLIAAFALSPLLAGKAAPSPAPLAQPAKEALLPDPGPALGWLALVDAGRWDASWDGTGAYFQARVSRASWAAMSQSVRQSLGHVTSRKLMNLSNTRNLPDAPAGDYAILRFQSGFEHKPDAIETVTLVHEGGGWKVLGYFIRNAP